MTLYKPVPINSYFRIKHGHFIGCLHVNLLSLSCLISNRYKAKSKIVIYDFIKLASTPLFQYTSLNVTLRSLLPIYDRIMVFHYTIPAKFTTQIFIYIIFNVYISLPRYIKRTHKIWIMKRVTQYSV